MVYSLYVFIAKNYLWHDQGCNRVINPLGTDRLKIYIGLKIWQGVQLPQPHVNSHPG